MNAIPAMEYVDGSYLEFNSLYLTPTSSATCIAMLRDYDVLYYNWLPRGCGQQKKYMCETPNGKVVLIALYDF